ncbi:LemA family protein [Chitinispirillum alkaliphilum]|nr:LemA family protein [Chitinispirillum alkaliphilum]
MGTILLILMLTALAVVVVYMIIMFNGLITLQSNISKSWSNIDILLKQRYDEIPKLLKVCEGYMIHERTTLENVTRARAILDNSNSKEQQTQASNMLSSTLRSLFAVAEKYPELKSDISFRQLQSRISEIEEMIADRREFYNETVNTYNIRIRQFPDFFIARQLGYRSRPMWKINPKHRDDVDIEFSYSSIAR